MSTVDQKQQLEVYSRLLDRVNHLPDNIKLLLSAAVKQHVDLFNEILYKQPTNVEPVTYTISDIQSKVTITIPTFSDETLQALYKHTSEETRKCILDNIHTKAQFKGIRHLLVQKKPYHAKQYTKTMKTFLNTRHIIVLDRTEDEELLRQPEIAVSEQVLAYMAELAKLYDNLVSTLKPILADLYVKQYGLDPQKSSDLMTDTLWLQLTYNYLTVVGANSKTFQDIRAVFFLVSQLLYIELVDVILRDIYNREGNTKMNTYTTIIEIKHGPNTIAKTTLVDYMNMLEKSHAILVHWHLYGLKQ